MNINEALEWVKRIENLPDIYSAIEDAVIAVINSYYLELIEVEKLEAEIISKKEYEERSLDIHMATKRKIHSKYWSNSAGFYQPCSTSSHPDHVWEALSDIEVYQNGDDDNQLFIFRGKYKDPSHGVVTMRVYILKRFWNELKIEHEFYG
ncbi:hypothetical protein ACMAZF_13510 [Psychrobium sp. nBUS_13]|uniref:hypothetical protein n=1 Tax=Psychrobium sp. nBUS_13 TaxID=3395319 RepID=UPI003EBF4F74